MYSYNDRLAKIYFRAQSLNNTNRKYINRNGDKVIDKYFETSAITGEGVNLLFSQICKIVLNL